MVSDYLEASFGRCVVGSQEGRPTRKMLPTVASCRGHTGTFETQDRVGNCGMRKEGVRRDLTEGVIIKCNPGREFSVSTKRTSGSLSDDYRR